MNSSLNHGSARIYQFPVGGRAALGVRRPDEARTPADLASRASETAFGDAWYHEAAIEDSKPVRES
jgi:hypothetical protein